MQYEYRRLELERALDDARTVDALEAAISAVAALHPDIEKPEILGRQMLCTGLDATIPNIARRLGFADLPLTKSNDNVCIVGTAFHSFGGHSKVAEDISRLIGAERTTVVLTDVYRERNHLSLLHPPKGAPLQRRATLLLGAQTLVGKVLELHNILAALRPTRIFLLTHHFDMVGPLALWPFREVVELLHHVDYQPGLGATLPWSAHVDLTWRAHVACRRAGLAPVYAGLTVAGVAEPRIVPRRDAPARLRIATSGSPHKFRGGLSHRWTDYAIAALAMGDTELLHIGPVEEKLRAEITEALVAAGIDPARYVFKGLVPSLAAALVDENVDVYLSSYPLGGGKANLEAMSVGLPPIMQLDEATPPLLEYGLPVDAWLRISSPAELPRAVAAALRMRDEMPGKVEALTAEFARFETYVRQFPEALQPLPTDVGDGRRV